MYVINKTFGSTVQKLVQLLINAFEEEKKKHEIQAKLKRSINTLFSKGYINQIVSEQSKRTNQENSSIVTTAVACVLSLLCEVVSCGCGSATVAVSKAAVLMQLWGDSSWSMVLSKQKICCAVILSCLCFRLLSLY